MPLSAFVFFCPHSPFTEGQVHTGLPLRTTVAAKTAFCSKERRWSPLLYVDATLSLLRM